MQGGHYTGQWIRVFFWVFMLSFNYVFLVLLLLDVTCVSLKVSFVLKQNYFTAQVKVIWKF